jgi:hypothetical protein
MLHTFGLGGESHGFGFDQSKSKKLILTSTNLLMVPGWLCWPCDGHHLNSKGWPLTACLMISFQRRCALPRFIHDLATCLQKPFSSRWHRFKISATFSSTLIVLMWSGPTGENLTSFPWLSFIIALSRRIISSAFRNYRNPSLNEKWAGFKRGEFRLCLKISLQATQYHETF